jgi:hypothetical protein
VTERRIVVLAFFAFLAVGAAVILVYASQPASNPSIQSGLGPATTRPHHASTSSTTPGTLPQPPVEVKGEVATSPTAPKATTGPKPTVTTTRRGGAPSLFGILAAPTVAPGTAPSGGTAKPAPAVATSPPGTTRTSPPTTKPDPTTTKPAPTTAAPTTTKPAPTTAAPTTAAPTTTKPAPTTAAPTTAAPTTTKPAPTTAPPTTAAPTTTAPPTTTQPKPILPPLPPIF